MNSQLILSLLVVGSIISYTGYLFSASTPEITVSKQDTEEICYGIILDCGSSSTKTSIYKWECRSDQSIPELKFEMPFSKTYKPGVASFAQKSTTELTTYIQNMLSDVGSFIPLEMQKYSPIIMGATAGMRLLSPEDQRKILSQVRSQLKSSAFLFETSEWAKVISGQEEGAFLWFTENYLMGNTKSKKAPTVSTIDVGGASTQLSFVSSEKLSENQVSLILPDVGIQYNLYSVSYLGYGNDQARIAVSKKFLPSSLDLKILYNPCYNKGYKTTWEGDSSVTLLGIGSELLCKETIKSYLNVAKCDYASCGMNGVFQPSIPLQIQGASSINYAASFFKIENSFTLKELAAKYNSLCSLDWNTARQTYASTPESILATQCFQGLYVIQLLSEGYKIDQETVLSAPVQISGVNVGWSLGYLLYQVGQTNCRLDSPECIVATRKLRDILRFYKKH